MKSNSNTQQQGFSLVELLIVVVTLGIIAAIAIPNMLAARRFANEGSAVSALRTLHGAQSTYMSSVGNGNYAGTDATTGDMVGLAALNSAGLIDSTLGTGVKSGYKFSGAITTASGSSPATFFFSANPGSPSGVVTQSGTKRYCVTQRGAIGMDATNIAVVYDSTTAPAASPIN